VALCAGMLQFSSGSHGPDLGPAELNGAWYASATVSGRLSLLIAVFWVSVFSRPCGSP
jgi:hypothetical protein